MSQIDKTLLKWFQLASLAPSAANNQPWSYSGKRVGQDYEVILTIHPEFLAAPSTVDRYLVTATIAIGCFAQNLEIAANLDGFIQNKFEQTGTKPQEYKWIYNFTPAPNGKINLVCSEKHLSVRVSNRTLYSQEPFSISQLEVSQKVLDQTDNLSFVRISAERMAWTKVLGQIEKVRINEDRLRHEMFEEFRTEKEMELEPVGLPIKTASNSILQQLLLILLKKIPMLQLTLKYFAAPLFSWLSLGLPMKHCGEIFALQICGVDPRDGHVLGRNLEKLWLHWTTLGYGVQMIALPVLIYGNREGLLGNRLTKENRLLLEEADVLAKQTLSLNLSLLTIVLRVGRAIQTTPNSPRRTVSQ